MAELLHEKDHSSYYPVFLNLRDRPALMVGAGGVAERKIEGLCEAGARVRVIAPQVTDAIDVWAQAGRVVLEKRVFKPGDVQDAFLVYCATNNPQVNAQVFKEAEACGVAVNVVDDPAHCSFIVPSIVRRGLLQIAISTGGASPSVAKGIRHELEQKYPSFFEDYLNMLNEFRTLVKTKISEARLRQALFEQAAEPRVLTCFREQKFSALELFKVFVDQGGTCEGALALRLKGDN